MSGQHRASRAATGRRPAALLRVLAGLLAAAVAVVVLPATAEAVFTRTAASSASVGSLTLVAPASVTLNNIVCAPETLNVRVNWPAVTGATTYRVTPIINGVAQPPVNLGNVLLYNHTAPTPGPATRTFTFTVQALRGTWTGAGRTSAGTVC